MKAWWENLAARERALITIAGGLTALVILWQLILVPTLANRADARVDLAQSDQTLTRVKDAYMAKRANGELLAASPAPGQSGVSNEAFKAQVTRSASDKGLSITRLQGGASNGVGVVFERADPRLLFLWLEDVETRLGGQVTRMTMEQAGDGAVRLSVDIEGAAG